MNIDRALEISDGNWMTVYGPEYNGFESEQEKCPFCDSWKDTNGDCENCKGSAIGQEPLE